MSKAVAGNRPTRPDDGRAERKSRWTITKIFAPLAGVEDIEQTITARTESEAQRYFKAAHKGTAADIFEISLIRENTTATKQQQRDTLEAIKKMVAELGPQSYLATWIGLTP